MGFRGWILGVTMASIGWTASVANAGVCAWPEGSLPARRQSEPGTVAQVWTLADAAIYESEKTPAAAAYVDMIRWVRGFIDDVDPFALLERQRSVFERHGMVNDVETFDVILRDRVGEVRKVRCLEALLLADHLGRFPIWERLTEFQALILHRGGPGSALRIYSVSANFDGMAPSLTSVMPEVREDLARGWTIAWHLHNHPFRKASFPGQDVVGTVIPSDPDSNTNLEMSRDLGLREARITNGFDTLVVRQAEFPRFVRAPSGNRPR